MDKICIKCGLKKKIDEFHRRLDAKDGHSNRCKECSKIEHKIYHQNNKQKDLDRNKKYRQTQKGAISHKLSVKKYMASKRGKSIRRNYERFSDIYKANHRKIIKRYVKEHPEITQAHHAVNHAVEAKKIRPVNSRVCFVCQKKWAKHYHHHKDYSKEHWLDVIPVCDSCHKAIHSKPIPVA